MAKAEFLLLAHVFNSKKFLSSGAFMSEKLDGFRAFWDGGITRGLLKDEVLWANTAKDHTRVQEQKATGLWTRYGNIIHAPDWFLDQLPDHLLDGELWCGRGNFQMARSIGSKFPENRVDADWKKVTYKVFDVPSPEEAFKERQIKDSDKFIKFIGPATLKWALQRLKIVPRSKVFQNTLAFLRKNLKETDNLQVLEQEQLPFATDLALKRVYEKAEEVVGLGGEGVILRRPQSLWIPERIHDIAKVKPWNDAEGTVIGYCTARETDKGSKLRGLMGTVILKFGKLTFELSGFTDEERVLEAKPPETKVPIAECRSFDLIAEKKFLVDPKAFKWAWENPSPTNGPGMQVPDWIHNPQFPIGSQVTFKYRELSDDGIPKEARYWRQPMSH